VLVVDGLIQEAAMTRRVENVTDARGAQEYNAAGRVVMPGFVDSHTHLLYPPPCPDGADPLRTLLATTGQRLARRGRGYLEAMVRHGTTTVEAKTGCGLNESAETKVLRALGTLHQNPIDVIPTFLFRLPPQGDPTAAESVFTELMPLLQRRRLAQFADLQWEDDSARYPLFTRYLEVARELGFACKIHADQAGPAAIAAAVEYSVVSVDHLEQVTPDQARMLANSSTVATLLPFTSFREGRQSSARTLIDAGAAVALGTDYNPAGAPSLNMQTALALACRNHGMTAAEAISAATINSAHAVGCGDRVGMLAYRKSADLLILNASDYRDLPQQFGTNLVHAAMKRGVFLYEEASVAGNPHVP